MEKLQNQLRLPSNDTSKYNLRCNRNISEKMTKKDFIYDIPAPFHQAMRNKEKSLPSVVQPKRPRGNFECLITQTASRGSGVSGKSEEKLNNKNPIGLLRLIQPQKLMPVITAARSNTSKSLNPVLQLRGREIKERIVREPERCNSTAILALPSGAPEETEKEIRRQIVLPIQLRRKIGSDSKPPRYSVIPSYYCNEEKQLTNSIGHQLPERKILGYQCNYCQERVATFMSLSTHVKYHRQRYCDTCFWILEPQESMSQHIQKTHRTFTNL